MNSPLRQRVTTLSNNLSKDERRQLVKLCHQNMKTYDNTYRQCSNHDAGTAEVASIAQEARIRVGEQIRRKRKASGLTLQELAARCDVTYQNIGKIENAKYSAGVDVLARIANALGINLVI